ncbi:VP+ [Scorpion polyomavirus 2]|nr:VP+ [Scorpion polyomavirus 2]QWB13316.1 VP+ [Scorpion polyomavirus 2]QWB13319.1 VP+ [Scorpion polyomavirus 2]
MYYYLSGKSIINYCFHLFSFQMSSCDSILDCMDDRQFGTIAITDGRVHLKESWVNEQIRSQFAETDFVTSGNVITINSNNIFSLVCSALNSSDSTLSKCLNNALTQLPYFCDSIGNDLHAFSKCLQANICRWISSSESCIPGQLASWLNSGLDKPGSNISNAINAFVTGHIRTKDGDMYNAVSYVVSTELTATTGTTNIQKAISTYIVKQFDAPNSDIGKSFSGTLVRRLTYNADVYEALGKRIAQLINDGRHPVYSTLIQFIIQRLKINAEAKAAIKDVVLETLKSDTDAKNTVIQILVDTLKTDVDAKNAVIETIVDGLKRNTALKERFTANLLLDIHTNNDVREAIRQVINNFVSTVFLFTENNYKDYNRFFAE